MESYHLSWNCGNWNVGQLQYWKQERQLEQCELTVKELDGNWSCGLKWNCVTLINSPSECLTLFINAKAPHSSQSKSLMGPSWHVLLCKAAWEKARVWRFAHIRVLLRMDFRRGRLEEWLEFCIVDSQT